MNFLILTKISTGVQFMTNWEGFNSEDYYNGQYQVDRSIYQDIFDKLAKLVDDSSYEHPINNDVFYYDGNSEVFNAVPNFCYKPTMLSIVWYKYPLRSAYANMALPDVEEFKKIIDNCIKSLSNYDKNTIS